MDVLDTDWQSYDTVTDYSWNERSAECRGTELETLEQLIDEAEEL